MIAFLIATVLTVTVMTTVAVVSFRLGRSKGFDEIFHIRMEAAQARRRMHDLTREAFVAMTEVAENVSGRQHSNEN